LDTMVRFGEEILPRIRAKESKGFAHA